MSTLIDHADMQGTRLVKKLAGFLAAVLAIYFVSASKADTVAYYRFENGTNGVAASGTNSILDSTGNGLNGTPFGSVTYTGNVPVNPIPLTGESNLLSLNFDGSTGRVFLPDYPLLALTNSLTIEAYINASVPTSPGGVAIIILRGDDRPQLDPYTLFVNTTPSLVFQITDANNNSAHLLAPISLHQWHHIAATLDGATGNMALYIDGVLVSSGNTSIRPYGALTGPNPGVGIGDVQSSNYADFFSGSIDEVRISDQALPPSELLDASCPSAATATATVVNGFVVGATITDSGCGYTNTPLVVIEGGGGSGATASAVVSNGFVSQIIITATGSNYSGIPTIFIGETPTITDPPQSVTVNAHDTAAFNVAATGSALINYQWSFNGTNIPGATSTNLTITNVMQTNLGIYTVAVSNPFGTNSASASLDMYPYLSLPFTGLDTLWGYTNTLSVQAWGTGPLYYQWFDNGVAIDDATNSALEFTGIQLTNAGLYTVVVSSALGSVTNTPEQVVIQPSGVSLGTYPGVTITGVVGYNYTIQRTTNLADTNSWVALTNVTLTQPVQLWVDTNINIALPSNPQQFYQVLPGQ